MYITNDIIRVKLRHQWDTQVDELYTVGSIVGTKGVCDPLDHVRADVCTITHTYLKGVSGGGEQDRRRQ